MIIDFHTHAFPDKIAAQTVAALAKSGNTKPYSDGTADGLLDALKRAGASIAVNQPVLTKPSQFESVVRFAGELNSRDYGAERIISFAGMHPGEEDIEGKVEEIYNKGFLGIKIHPDYQGAYIDDSAYVRIVSAAKRHGLIVLTHSGLDIGFVGQPIKCTPRRVLKLLDAVGGYDKLVLAHIGASEMFDEVLGLLSGEDVYFDTAYCLRSAGKELFTKILEKHGEDKILFGSDSPWRDIFEEVEIIKSYGFGEKTEEKILSENAIKLLGLTF